MKNLKDAVCNLTILISAVAIRWGSKQDLKLCLNFLQLISVSSKYIRGYLLRIYYYGLAYGLHDFSRHNISINLLKIVQN